ncbi:MAG TPA: TPM domain-containing protein [Candidatus Cloacimonadota bacterium]|nr:TPM domain-containing protein [Candidatus Cloacimonadota bacterium]
MKKIIGLLVSILLFSSLSALGVPALKGHVNDYANVLTSQQKTKLESYLTNYEQATSIQVALLTIKSLQGENLENYSMQVAEKWKLGQKEQDNGVLLLVAMQEKKLRIEVGYGLEGTLTDAKSGYIIRNYIVPSFKTGDYFNGISAGIGAITGVLSKDLVITDEQIAQSQKEEESSGVQIPFVFLVILFMAVFGGFGRRRRGGLLPFLFLGSMMGGNDHHRGGGFGGFGGGGFGGFSGGGGGFGGGGASGGW